ncbi:MAG: DUF4169 family protein [Alphaproteobacteria bacterium]|nr:DUF4169 family protein [Alphaproteobacteria bacterium]
MTSVVINFNRVRKAKRREDAERRAAENRVFHGRGKVERLNEERDKDRAARELDGKRRD